MQVSLSATSIFDLDKPERYLNYISSAGFNSIMLDAGIFLPKVILENYGEEPAAFDMQKLKLQFDRLIEQAGKKSLHFEIMRSPHLKWNTKRTDLKDFMLKVGKDCIESCKKAGCKTVIIQPLFAGISKADMWQANYHYFLELGKYAKERDVCILLENQCSNVNGHFIRGVCSDAKEASSWIDGLNRTLEKEVFGFCLDTGASAIARQNMGEQITTLGNRLKAVLIRESDVSCEASRLPFTGMNEHGANADWRSLMISLRRIEFDGGLICDVFDTLRGFSALLRPNLYAMVKSAADFFAWQIGLEKSLKKYKAVVLFGAGNMCRNYMRCYGEQYPPLFTCDNNSRLWGTTVDGLEVKNPEELKNLPEGCGVFICNIYYKEIEKQLRDMGIQNIEFFNDEYLPCYEC